MKYTTDKYIAKGNQDICEDSMIVEQINGDSLLCIIADGMGELDNASDASRLVVEEIYDFILIEISEEKIPVESILSGAIEKANERINKERQQLFCTNRKQEGGFFYHPIVKDSELDPNLFLGAGQIYRLLNYQKPACELFDHCVWSRDIMKSNADPDTRCFSPWLRCNDERLCPYSLVWKHWNLGKHKPHIPLF